VILADTSIWIDHFRSSNKQLHARLQQGRIVTHPFVVAELALASLRDRMKTLSMLDLLPQVRMPTLAEVRLLIEARQLYSQGMGLTDAYLLASVLINSPTLLWTRDKQLGNVAKAFGIHADLA
jgi:hypothetical protein